jgi:hypothetical protein
MIITEILKRHHLLPWITPVINLRKRPGRHRRLVPQYKAEISARAICGSAWYQQIRPGIRRRDIRPIMHNNDYRVNKIINNFDGFFQN